MRKCPPTFRMLLQIIRLKVCEYPIAYDDIHWNFALVWSEAELKLELNTRDAAAHINFVQKLGQELGAGIALFIPELAKIGNQDLLC